MLKIQLCPESELENHLWWVVDVASFVLCGGIVYLAAIIAMNSIRDDIATTTGTSQNWATQLQTIKPAVEKFKDLDVEVALLNRKIDALKHITVSPIDKVLPIVVAEQLQTLRPEGLWFHNMAYREDKTLTMKGSSNDSLLISEFLLTITSDIRTQIGFSRIEVKDVVDQKTDAGFRDLTNVLAFEVTTEIKEKKKVATVPVSVAVPEARSAKRAMF
ncbi:MAG: hypothetical protein NTV34_07610 [Proteobacteria bacterium]|nr:hypothetical protein [Pseudomonadota bacterium]